MNFSILVTVSNFAVRALSPLKVQMRSQKYVNQKRVRNASETNELQS